MQHRLIPACLTALATAVLIGGCGGQDNEITVRPMDSGAAPAVQPAGASAADRFGFRPASGMGGTGMPSAAKYQFETPSGWQLLPATQMRPINFRVGRDPNAEAYFTTEGGGTMTANVNRWRAQMGLPEISDEEVAQLPTHPLMGVDATYVALDGAFSGMGNEPKENYRMLGLIALEGGKAYFVKMTGPAPILEGQEENFLAFAASIEEGADPHAGLTGDPHAGLTGDPHAGIAGMDTAATSPIAWRWDAPDGWTKAPDRPMRLVTYTSGPENQNEVYIAELGGAAGGVEMNLNRWQQQMGQPPLAAAEIEALSKVTVLGHEAPVVEIHGTFSDGMRGGTFPDYTMLGTVIPTGDRTLFVKMTGPQDLMQAEKDNFIAFTESITRAE